MAKYVSKRFNSHVHEVRVPTLLVGIGGIGGRIVTDVCSQLNDYDKQYVEMVVLDTNINDLEKVQDMGIKCVQTSENRTVQDYISNNPEFLDWFPANKLINSKNLVDGAGQIRAVSRLGALASEDAGRLKEINQAIDKLMRNRGETLTKAIKVMIVGSVTGGTGSGIAIQLPFYIREAISRETNSPEILIRGLFLMPDITDAAQMISENEDAMYVNGYAFLRELNAFYRALTLPDEEIKISIEHYNGGKQNEGLPEELKSSNQVPYDFTFLLEKTNSKGANIGSVTGYERKAAKIVKNQLFSPVSNGQYSAEDNLIIAAVPKKGMNKYCGAGHAAAVYPRDEVLRYCTLKYSETVIRDFWLYFDNLYKINSKVQRKQMAFNSTLAPLREDEEYIKNFEKQTKDLNARAEFALLNNDITTVYVRDDGQRVETTLPQKLYRSMLAYIKKRCQERSETVIDFTDEDFTLNAAEVKNKMRAADKISQIIDNLEEYRRDIKKLVNELIAECSQSILPTDMDIVKFEGNNADYSIYNALKGLHPLSVRYVLYSLRKQLQAEVKRSEAWIANNSLNVFEGKDYDGEPENGTQSPTDVVRSYLTAKWTTKIVNAISGDYNDLIDTVIKDAATEKELAERFKTEKLINGVFSILVGRLDKWIAVYESFFKGMDQIIKDNAVEIAQAEENDEYIFDGDRYICADGDCKKWISNEIVSAAGGAMMEISEEVKTKLYDGLFDEYAKLVAKDMDAASYSEDLSSVREIFENCVVPAMADDVLKHGANFIDISILEAIDKEYKIHLELEKSRPGEETYKSLTPEQYRKTVINNVASLASPFILAKDASNSRIMAYWGINNSVLSNYQQTKDGKPDVTAFMDMLGTSSDVKYASVIDSSFSECELVCYQVIYSLEIENLPKYKNGSHCYNCYVKRIEEVMSKNAEIQRGATGYLSTVHPHLDKRWHNKAYLPLLDEGVDAAEDMSLVKAFIMSLALGICKYDEYDYTMCWCATDEKGVFPIIAEGRFVTNESYYELHESFDYNELLKKYVLETVKKIEKEDYDKLRISMDGAETSEDRVNVYYKNLCEQKLIEALIGKGEGNINVMDVVCSVFDKMGNNRLVSQIEDCLIKFLIDYCKFMTNDQVGLSRHLLTMIVEEICSSSNSYAAASKNLKLAFEKKVENATASLTN